jgi:hypothetical protein
MWRLMVVAVAAGLVSACGGGDTGGAVVDGAVVYRDTLLNNRDGWVVGRDAYYRDDGYHWDNVPGWVVAGSDALLERDIPPGIAASVGVTQERGAALRAIVCRSSGPRDGDPQDWYELGIDGRRALIRRLAQHVQPRVLARADAPVANGRRVRLTATCVPDADGGLVLTLRLDGREVVRARDGKPIGATFDGLPTMVELRAYPRPDTREPPNLVWKDFEVRRAALANVHA